MFRVYDYTDATRLFGEEFITKAVIRKEREEGPIGEPTPPERSILVEGFDVRVTEAGRYILTEVDGRAIPVTLEEYKERLAAKLVEEAPTLETFRQSWVTPPVRRELLGKLPDGGRSALLVQQLEEMGDYDLYDVLGELGYGLNPQKSRERADAFNYKNAGWLSGLPSETQKTLFAMTEQFAQGGIDSLESPHIFELSAVRSAGGLAALKLPPMCSRHERETVFGIETRTHEPSKAEVAGRLEVGTAGGDRTI